MIQKANLTTVIVNTAFEGVHQYTDAPEEVSYLREPHRHVFHVNLEVEVFSNDRELEFIMIKHRVDRFLKEHQFPLFSSCEQIATIICMYISELYGKRKIVCQVLEDGENGGKVYYGY